MAKPKKEFKARVRKMQKHVEALIELTPAGPHFDRLYVVQGELDELTKIQDRIFDRDQDGPAQDIRDDRRGPLPVAG